MATLFWGCSSHSGTIKSISSHSGTIDVCLFKKIGVVSNRNTNTKPTTNKSHPQVTLLKQTNKTHWNLTFADLNIQTNINLYNTELHMNINSLTNSYIPSYLTPSLSSYIIFRNTTSTQLASLKVTFFYPHINIYILDVPTPPKQTQLIAYADSHQQQKYTSNHTNYPRLGKINLILNWTKWLEHFTLACAEYSTSLNLQINNFILNAHV